MTRFWELLAPLGDGWFLVASDAVFFVAGMIGLELVLMAVGWQGRWLTRAFLLTSLPLVTALFTGNPSPLLLLAWGGALLAVKRDRPYLAGALLAVGLIKPPVGLPAAAALVLAFPGSQRRMLVGAGAGAGAFGAANVVIGGPGQVAAWLGSLVSFSPTLNVHQATVIQQCCLAGLSAPFLGLGPLPAMAIAVVVIAVPALWLYRAGVFARVAERQPLLWLSILITAALGVTPYVHPNDLLLEAVPLLFLATTPLTLLNRAVLTLWVLGLPLNLLAATILVDVTGDANKPWGYGVILTGLTLLALGSYAVRQHRAAVAAGEPVPA
jgi:hypothetical protein